MPSLSFSHHHQFVQSMLLLCKKEWCAHVMHTRFRKYVISARFDTSIFHMTFPSFYSVFIILTLIPSLFVVFVFYSLLVRLSIQLVGDNEKYRNSNNNHKTYKETKKKITHATSNQKQSKATTFAYTYFQTKVDLFSEIFLLFHKVFVCHTVILFSIFEKYFLVALLLRYTIYDIFECRIMPFYIHLFSLAVLELFFINISVGWWSCCCHYEINMIRFNH